MSFMRLLWQSLTFPSLESFNSHFPLMTGYHLRSFNIDQDSNRFPCLLVKYPTPWFYNFEETAVSLQLASVADNKCLIGQTCGQPKDICSSLPLILINPFDSPVHFRNKDLMAKLTNWTDCVGEITAKRSPAWVCIITSKSIDTGERWLCCWASYFPFANDLNVLQLNLWSEQIEVISCECQFVQETPIFFLRYFSL